MSLQRLNLKEVEYIIIHCTATPRGRAVTVADVDKWHRERGFRKIGYHYLVGLDGTVYLGRALSEIGAHCQGSYNSKSIGVCYVGGLDEKGRPCDTRTVEQKKAIPMLIADIEKTFGKRLKVIGHHDVNNTKSCPCFEAKAEYANR